MRWIINLSHSDSSLGYSCALVSDILLQGHLYITENYFAFHSNVFGYVTKVREGNHGNRVVVCDLMGSVLRVSVTQIFSARGATSPSIAEYCRIIRIYYMNLESLPKIKNPLVALQCGTAHRWGSIITFPQKLDWWNRKCDSDGWVVYIGRLLTQHKRHMEIVSCCLYLHKEEARWYRIIS